MTTANRICAESRPASANLLAPSVRLQRKLSIGATDDPSEFEADRVADQVLAVPVNATLASVVRPGILGCSEHSRENDGVAPASVSRELSTPGNPLDSSLRDDMERRFGRDFSLVRVHSGASAAQSARDVSAQAYTVGRDIVFGAGRFAPSTGDGRHLLAHELTHAIQQGATSTRTDGVKAPGAQQTVGRTHVQRQPSAASNAVDKQAQAIIDAAKDSTTTPDVGARAVAAVRAIINTYYPSDAAKVSAVEFDDKDPGLTTSPVGSGATLKGKITVGRYFVEHIDSFARRTLQVGHELQHIDQQRAGMGGPLNQNKREFLAFAWEALQEPKTGTGRLSYAMRRDMIDCALGHLFCLSSEEQKSFEDKKIALTQKRAEVNGKGGNPSTEAPTTCKPCSRGNTASPPGKTGADAGPSDKVTTQPAPTQVGAGDSKSDARKNSGEEADKAKIEGAIAVGGEREISREGVESMTKLSFEAVFPVGALVAPGGLKTRPLLGGAPLKFFNEFSLESSVGFKRGDTEHPWLTPLAVEGSLKMVSVEWERLTRLGAFKIDLGVAGVGSAEYAPQNGEAKFAAGGELGVEDEYRLKKDSPFFAKVGAKAQIKFGKTGDAEFRWEGASFSAEAKVGVSF